MGSVQPTTKTGEEEVCSNFPTLFFFLLVVLVSHWKKSLLVDCLCGGNGQVNEMSPMGEGDCYASQNYI